MSKKSKIKTFLGLRFLINNLFLFIFISLLVIFLEICKPYLSKSNFATFMNSFSMEYICLSLYLIIFCLRNPAILMQ